MTAGLPGLGLGGIFFIVSALIAPLVELVRTARGRSSARAWREVMRQFAIAVVMIFSIDLTLRVLFLLAPVVGLGSAREANELTVLPLLPIAITMALLAGLLATAKAAELVARARAAPLPRLLRGLSLPVPARARLLGGGASLVATWTIGLVIGAAELSPLSSVEPTPDRPASQSDDGVASRSEPGGDRVTPSAEPSGYGSGEQGVSSARSGSAAGDEEGGPDASTPAVAPEADGSTGSGPDAEVGPGAPAPGADGPGSDAPGADPPAADTPPAPTPEPPAPTPEPPAQPPAPPATGPPATPGPPADAGPPAHSNAPEWAGPPGNNANPASSSGAPPPLIGSSRAPR